MLDEKTSTSTATGVSPRKYQLLMELGRGGMGVAHLAMARGPQGFTKLVVLKMMRKQLIGDDDCYQMFLQEARISARLAHPNVVHVYEVIEYEDTPTLVMEYLDGQTLWSIVRNDAIKLPLPLHLHILTKVLSGLHAAHELRDYDGTRLNLMHRDVSPHNVCVLFDGQVKVLDFGIAKGSTSDVETRVGELKGKVRYMPPEQLIRSQQDRRVDIFSVGVMLWEALMGRRYWGDAAEGDVISSLLAKNLPSLPSLETQAQLRFICAQALAPDPDYRYTTAGEFQRDLEDYLLGELDRASAEEQLAAFMHQHFEGERQAAQRAIEEHLQAAERISQSSSDVRRRVVPPGVYGTLTPSAAARLPAAASSDADTRVLVAPSPSVSPPQPSAPAAEARAAPAATPPRFRAGVLALGAVLGLAMTVVYAVARPARPALGEPGAPTGRLSDVSLAPGCAQGFKACGGRCVSVGLPDHGCGAQTCAPCREANAAARCDPGDRCAIAGCYPDFDDCDGDPGNGCETNVRTDPDNCRGCGRKCPPLPRAQRGCGDACTIWRCEGGFRDCNGVVEDGCEAAVTDDPANCGHCGRACRHGQRCQAGVCK